MKAKLTVSRTSINGNHIVFTRNDGKVFHLDGGEDGRASFYRDGFPPPRGISWDISVDDKIGAAEEMILKFPAGWPHEGQE